LIISASRRTDIPAFFSQWFMETVKQGYSYVANPFTRSRVKGYSLKPEDVDVIVFWSKNPRRLMKHVAALDSMGYRYYFQFTLNDYPEVFEPNLPEFLQRVETFNDLSRALGSSRVVWRWDPIIVSSLTPAKYHIEHIERAAQMLQGYSDRLVISFLDFYGKVRGRLERLRTDYGIQFTDVTVPERRQELLELAGRIFDIGKKYGFEVQSCAEATDLSQVGNHRGACIDGQLIRRLFGVDKDFRKDKGQRPECLCAESVDIGAYNTCTHECAYCYANYSRESIRKNLARHVADGPLLIGTYEGEVEITKEPGVRGGRRQANLFVSEESKGLHL